MVLPMGLVVGGETLSCLDSYKLVRDLTLFRLDWSSATCWWKLSALNREDEASLVSLVGEVIFEPFRPLVSLESLSEVRWDLEVDSSSWMWAFCTLEPRSLEEVEDVEDVDVVDELEFGLVAVARSRFGFVAFGLLLGDSWLIRKSLLRVGF